MERQFETQYSNHEDRPLLDDAFPTPHALADKYQFIREIGHGSQGHVFLAERLSDHQRVVVKQLNIGSVKNWKEYTLFKREGEVLASLHIDGVAEFYEARECLNDDQPCAYIVQEYIPGKSIQSLLKENWHFNINEFYDVVLQLLCILEQLQKHNPPIIHRDIKPSNIILVPQKRGYKAYLIDFGAVANPQVQGGGSTVAGTFGYMAPEQLMGAPVPASDIYSLGALIVHVLSGVSPADMPVKDFRLIFEPEVQSLPHNVVEILRQMLEPKADERLCDIAYLKGIFNQFRNEHYKGNIHNSDAKTTERSKERSKEAYIKKLQNVTNYGADGNIELWAALSDSFKQNSLLDCIDQTMDWDELGIVDLKKASEQSFGKKVWGSFRIFLYNLVIFPFYSIVNLSSFICLMIIVPMSLIPGIWPWIIKSEYLTDKKIYVGKESFWNAVFKFSIIGNILWVISLVIIIFCGLFHSYNSLFVPAVIWGCIYILHVAHINLHYDEAVTKDDRIIHIKRMSKDARTIEKEKAINLYLERLNQSNQESLSPKWLKNARKTMATVIDIQYEPVQDVFVLEPDEKNINYMVYGVPSFRVIYSFNPPDDSREEDLHHAFTTHSDPTGHLKVGDPLPILYAIEKKGRDERVRSTPFPWVWGGHLNNSEIIASSAGIVSLNPFKPQ